MNYKEKMAVFFKMLLRFIQNESKLQYNYNYLYSANFSFYILNEERNVFIVQWRARVCVSICVVFSLYIFLKLRTGGTL